MLNQFFNIRILEDRDIPYVTKWSRLEGFAPGLGDVDIYKHTDQQGLWIGSLGDRPIGCIAGVRYNSNYGFIGLFIIEQHFRGNGYGRRLWQHALEHLKPLKCIGLEAALDRVDDYSKWGFEPSSFTTRLLLTHKAKNSILNTHRFSNIGELNILEGNDVPSNVVQNYDKNKEPSPRPHFLSDWIKHPEGTVLSLIDSSGSCRGFGRIRPCLLKKGQGWRIGPLIADNEHLAEALLKQLMDNHPGSILVDSPGLNKTAIPFFNKFGFKSISQTLRMYRGSQPTISMSEVYGLACLELG